MSGLLMRVMLASSGTVLLFSGIAAAAAPPSPRNGEGQDRDRVITRAQAQANAAETFDRLDVNHDGKIDATDLQQAKAERREARFEKLDANKDGMISRAEYESPAATAGHARSDHFDGRFGGRQGSSGGMMALVRLADTDKNGAVTKAEFLAATDKRFTAMDLNHDGKITREDRQAAREARRSKWMADKPAAN